MSHQGDAPVRRCRQHYRQYQRRRRQNQRERMFRLEGEVYALAQEVAQLKDYQSFLLFSSRGADIGGPASVISEFYRVYARGHDDAKSESQDAFLRSVMAGDVQGPDFGGVDALVEQWHLYGDLFAAAMYEVKRTTVLTLQESTAVDVDVLMTVRPNRRGVACLCPSLGGREAAIQQMLARPLCISGSVRFLFDDTGRITWMGADMDFVAAIADVLSGFLDRVIDLLDDSRISLCTGKIATCSETQEPETAAKPATQSAPCDARHAISFLLS